MTELSVESVVFEAEPNLTTGLLRTVYATTICVVCQEMMHFPFSTTCGHTACYSCLNEWLTRQPQCPQCRTQILKEPVFNRSLQAVVEGFVDTAKLINPQLSPQIEAEIEATRKVYESDRVHKKLFKDIFANATTCVIDRSDGVPRCGSCHWEAHGSQCLNCGIRFTIAPDDEDYYDGEEAYDEDGEDTFGSAARFIQDAQMETFRRYAQPSEDEGSSGGSFIDDRSEVSADSDGLLDDLDAEATLGRPSRRAIHVLDSEAEAEDHAASDHAASDHASSDLEEGFSLGGPRALRVSRRVVDSEEDDLAVLIDSESEVEFAGLSDASMEQAPLSDLSDASSSSAIEW